MLKLALLGGQPHIKEKMEWGSFWPPIDEQRAKNLRNYTYPETGPLTPKSSRNLPSRLLNIMVPSMAYLWQMGL